MSEPAAVTTTVQHTGPETTQESVDVASDRVVTGRILEQSARAENPWLGLLGSESARHRPGPSPPAGPRSAAAPVAADQQPHTGGCPPSAGSVPDTRVPPPGTSTAAGRPGPSPGQPRPAVPAPKPVQHQFTALERTGPQIPVTHDVGGHRVLTIRGHQLDPEAQVFVPASQGAATDELLDSPDVIEGLLAGVDDSAESVSRDVPPPPPCLCHNLPRGSCPEFVERFVNLVVEVRSFNAPNMDGARREVEDRQIDPEPWDKILATYFDKKELVAALRYGWDFSLAPDPNPADSQSNLPSALEYPDHVDEYVRTELAYGALVGPLPEDLPWPVFRSPLGTVAKPRCPEKRRTITDCSQRGRGINGWIRHDFHRGRYVKTCLPGTEEIVVAIRRVRLLSLIHLSAPTSLRRLADAGVCV